MQGASKVDPIKLKQQAFQKKHSDLLLKVADAFGDAIHRQDVEEITMLSVALKSMVLHSAEMIKELDSRSVS